MADERKKNIIDSFIDGANNGLSIVTKSTMPNVIFAFIIIRILNLTGLLDLIGTVMAPIMGLFGVPGVAATVLMASILSMGGGFGVAAGLATEGLLSSADVTIIFPAIMLMGAFIQYMGRILATAGLNSKYYPHMLIISVINGLLSMLIMRVLIGFF